MNRINEQKKIRQQRKCIIALLILLLLTLCLLLNQCQDGYEPGQTAVIEENEDVELTDTEKGTIRIKISPVIKIRNRTMQNMNFCNYNKDRLLRCKIKFGEEYIYDSGFLAEGQMLKGDYIKTHGLQAGSNEAVAEIYSYSNDEVLLGQTNVKVVLNLET